MNIGTINKIKREDLPEAPAWVDKLLNVLNPFISTVVTALTGRIEFEANIPAQRQAQRIIAGAAATDNTARFKCAMKVAPFGCLIVQAVQVEAQYTAITAAVTIGSWRYEKGDVIITSIVGLTAGKTYDLLILVI